MALGSVSGNPAQDELAAFSLELAGGEQMGSGLTVASSSVAVFNYIKTSARRCATLNTGLALVSNTFYLNVCKNTLCEVRTLDSACASFECVMGLPCSNIGLLVSGSTEHEKPKHSTKCCIFQQVNRQ